MGYLEWIAAASGFACVALVARRSLWNYPFAIVSVALLSVVFWEARLYSDALLQLFFIAINIYGWISWTRSADRSGEVTVQPMVVYEQVAALAAVVGLTLAWGLFMATQTDAAFPFVDASVAVMSIAAQFMQARRYLECWYVWIAVDLVAIPLYAARGLYAASGLYLAYLVLSLWGLYAWRGARRESRT